MAWKSFTLTSSRLRIPSAWVREIISETLATYVFVLLSIAVVAQEAINGVGPSTGIVVNLSISLALTMAIYVSGNASGGYVNPGIALSMCLTGYLAWRKYPVYILCYFIGAFLASATVYAIYNEDIDLLYGGQRLTYGQNGTAYIFASYPTHQHLSKQTAFMEVMIAHALLVLCTLALADERNLAPSKGFVPIPIGLSVFTICTGFSHKAGCPINATKDLAPRLMLLLVGYGTDSFTYLDYWFWIPPVATVVGSILATLTYQLCIGLQWEPLLSETENDCVSDKSHTEPKEDFVMQIGITSVVDKNAHFGISDNARPKLTSIAFCLLMALLVGLLNPGNQKNFWRK